MIILGIESSSLVASAAVVKEDILLAEYSVNHKKTHSQTLLPMIDEVTRMIELDLRDIDGIAISKGPGSFTGLRIGSATAKGLGLALDKPIIPVPTLDAMAFNFYRTADLICPIMDARREQVYAGLYDGSDDFKVLIASCAIPMRELLKQLQTYCKPVLFLGDGVPAYQEMIREYAAFPFSFAPAHLNRQRAGSVAALGQRYLEAGKIETPAEHKPDYIRVAQAQRELMEKGIVID